MLIRYIIRILHKHEKSPDNPFKSGVKHTAAQMGQLLAGGADDVHIYTINKTQIAEHCARHSGRM